MSEGPNPLPPASVPVLDANNALTQPWRRALQQTGSRAVSGITELTGDVTATGPGVAVAQLSDTGVTPGSYTNMNATVDAQGRVVEASDGSGSSTSDPLSFVNASLLDGYFTVQSAYKLARPRTFTYTGDATGGPTTFDGSANVSTALTLSTTGVSAGTYGDATHVGQFAVDAKGRITSASNVPITAGVTSFNTRTGAIVVAAGSNITITESPTGTFTFAASGGGTGTVTHTAGALTAGQLVFGNGAADITVGDLSGDVSTSGSGATTIGALKIATGMIQASAVTLAKIQNAAANSKLLGSGAAGSGAAYSEITLGTGLSMSGTTLNASAGSGTVTNTGTLTSGQLIKGNGGVDVTVGDLSGDVSTSGALVTAIGANKVTNAMLRQSGALAVVGRSANSTGNVADIQATAGSGKPLIETGSTLAFGTLTVIGGGTGAVTLTNHGVLLGQGTSAVAATAAGTSGDVLTSNGASADPTYQTPARVLISEQSPSGTGTVTFSTIAATYRDLQVVVRGAGTKTATFVEVRIQLNTDTGANYDEENLIYNFTTPSPGGAVTATYFFAGYLPAASGVASASSAAIVDILNYRDTTFHKTLMSRYGVRTGATTAGLFVGTSWGDWRNTAAVTSITVFLDANNYTSGSVVSLYGLM
jgi:hypothetical protein